MSASSPAPREPTTTVEAPPAEVPVMADLPDSVTLNATDRCDRCGAQAYVMTSHEFGDKQRPENSGDTEGDLLWCKHHFYEYDERLASLIVVDERFKLDGPEGS